ncbi:anthranilate phosphoribosyltransferase [Jeotgalibacillus soli]|uniref:Anthranilate phosphoribosyltransferase n=1 Tax=Jeotgalibacillus soli TaxID=889306 RepID=A0A0C2VM47_9BACL|nr:anthranilate phosphoribosyltransferase [Jeotgalibacillus soli]KIL45496.1 anthranilate phosphoribosyltransferase [Jeotgalibacillus soli]
MKRYLEKIIQGNSLTVAEMMEASEYLFQEQTSDSEIAAFLVALKAKGESVDEIVGLVNVVRKHALKIDTTATNMLDNCGTGGDGSKSFNISTTAAFVMAGAGVTVAKHGNRSISSKTGSADVLEHLGVRLDFTPEEMKELLEMNGIAFLFAPHIHSGIKRVMKVRKDLGIPTIFNLIGPLTNPVDLDSQLLGIYRRDMIETMALAMNKLGRKRGVVVNGAGHMDEASLAGENHLAIIEDNQIKLITLTPEEVHLPVIPNAEITGGDSKDNAKILRSILDGESSVFRDTVLLNAGLGLFAHGTANSVQHGIELAAESIDSGRAKEKLDNLIHYSNKGAIAK